MARFERFTFLCDRSERRAIAELAERLQRSQSDAVRFVVVEAARQLVQADTAPVGAVRAEDPNHGGTNATG